VVFTNFHEANSISVGEVIKVFKETMFLSISLVVITVLLDSFASHVLTVNISLINSSTLIVLDIKSNLSNRGINVISVVNVNNISFNTHVTLFSTFPESVSNTTRAVLEYLWAISVLSVLKFKDFLFN
jgi:hypothetical protein